MGKGSATAISNIKRHLTGFSFCTGYLALGFRLISLSHFLRSLHMDSSLCNVRPDTWIVDQASVKSVQSFWFRIKISDINSEVCSRNQYI
jgi:hypothetical protein